MLFATFRAMKRKRATQTPPGDLAPLVEVKNYLNGELSAGRAVTCPACGGNVKIYARRLDLSMVQILTAFYFAIRTGKQGGIMYAKKAGPIFGSRFYHYTNALSHMVAAGDYAKLRLWEFMEPHPEKSGYWTVTQKGRLFVEGKLDAPLYRFILHGHLVQQPRETLKKEYLQRVTIAMICKGFDLEDLYIDYLKNDP